jgi:hypothetical protein
VLTCVTDIHSIDRIHPARGGDVMLETAPSYWPRTATLLQPGVDITCSLNCLYRHQVCVPRTKQ